MADSVQYHLEKMLPEIEDLEKRGIFSPAEIKSIIRKRTGFEYAIHKKVSKKSDFLRYIEYEINLDRLRRTRKARLGLDQPKKPSTGKKDNSLSDHSLVTRIHGIYSKALRKFSGDVMLWMQYFDWCKATKSSKALGSSFARAVQLHPTESKLWIACAKYEFEENSNIASARILLQRGLRINGECQKLWLEYFKLEMLWIQKIKLRRKVLLDEEIGSDGVNVPTLDIENSKESISFNMGPIPDVNQSELFEKALLEFTIPRAVYRNAIKAIPNDLNFRKSFISIYQQFNVLQHDALEDIYSGFSTDFTSGEALSVVCQRFISGIAPSDPAFPLKLKETILAFQECLNSNPFTEFFSCFVEFLKTASSSCQDTFIRKYLSIVLEKGYEQGDSLNIISAIDFADWASLSDKKVEIIEKGLQKFNHDSSLWLLKIDSCDLEHKISAYEDSLRQVRRGSSYPIWSSYLDHLINIKSESTCSKFMESLTPLYLDGTMYEMKMIEKYLAWSNSIGIEKVRNVTKSLLSYKVRSPEFYRFAISLELKCSPQNPDSICKLYDLCIQSGDCPVNMWLDYIGYKLSIGDINGSCHLASKAKREIADQESFMIAYEQFKNLCS